MYLKENTTRIIIGYKGEEVPTELDGTVQQIHDYEVTEQRKQQSRYRPGVTQTVPGS